MSRGMIMEVIVYFSLIAIIYTVYMALVGVGTWEVIKQNILDNMGTTTGNDSIKTMFAGIYFGLPAVLIGVILRPFVFGFRKEGIESEWQGQRTYIQR